jgi:methylmalonyl-CoA mutase
VPDHESEQPDVDDWQTLAEKELRGTDPESLVWHTPEGIDVKPLYTGADLTDIGAVDSLPGFDPFLRGVRATMYANRPWTIRQYAGF